MPGIGTGVAGGHALVAFRIVPQCFFRPCDITQQLCFHPLEIALPFRVERRFPGRILGIGIAQILDAVSRERMAADKGLLIVLRNAETEFIALQLLEKVNRAAPGDAGL